jgi:uncharacterized protein (TIRG00374 family)
MTPAAHPTGDGTVPTGAADEPADHIGEATGAPAATAEASEAGAAPTVADEASKASKASAPEVAGEAGTPEAADEADEDARTVIEAPEPPARVHRPLDLARLIVALFALVAALLIGSQTVHTVAGIGADVNAAIRPVPATIVVLATVASGLMLLALPIAVAIDLLVRRRFRILAEALLALALAMLIVSGFRLVIEQNTSLALALIGTGAGLRPLSGFVAAIVALVTVARVGQRPRWRVVTAAVFLLVGVALIVVGFTALSVVVSLLIGRVVGLLVLWVAGSPPSRPSPRDVVAALRRVQVDVVSLRARKPDVRDPVLFDVLEANGDRLVVYVLDRDHVGSGLLPSFWRTLRSRQAAGWWMLLSLRRTLDQLALVSMAMASAGVTAQRLIVTAAIEPEAAMLVYTDVPGPSFADAPADEITDKRLDAAWEQVALMHDRAIAHRALDAENLVATTDGGAGLRVTSTGLVAAGETALRIDLAHLLVTSALLIGAERAVASGLRVVGHDRLANAMPLLQPIVLGQPTRRQLRTRGQLLDQLREEILAAVPSAPVEPVRIERLRMRTVVSAVALTAAAYVLVGQLAGLDLVTVLRQADWRWLLLAVLLASLRFVGAALGLFGFVAERLSFMRTVWVQVAASFVALVAPAGVGGAALNVRYLQRSGVPAAAAVASVALWQLGSFVTTVAVLLLLNVISGANQTELLSVPSEALIALAVLVAIGAIVVAVPAGRRFVIGRLRPYVSQIVPRVGSVLSRPVQLLTGVAGTLVQTVTTVLVMGVCIDAFGGSVSWVAVALIVLAGTAVGSAAPTPGGLGAVEAVLTAALTAATGLDGAVAVSSVLLFRLLTFWLPVVPGWFAFTVLQRRNAI